MYLPWNPLYLGRVFTQSLYVTSEKGNSAELVMMDAWSVLPGTHKQFKWLLFQEVKNTNGRETFQIWLQPVGSNSLSVSEWESNMSDKKWLQSENFSFCVWMCVCVYLYIYTYQPMGTKEKWGNVLEVSMDKPGKAKPKTKRWLARYTQNQRESSYVSTQWKIKESIHFFMEWETKIFGISSWLLSSCLHGNGQLWGRCLVQLMGPQMTAWDRRA